MFTFKNKIDLLKYAEDKNILRMYNPDKNEKLTKDEIVFSPKTNKSTVKTDIPQSVTTRTNILSPQMTSTLNRISGVVAGTGMIHPNIVRMATGWSDLPYGTVEVSKDQPQKLKAIASELQKKMTNDQINTRFESKTKSAPVTK